MEGSEYSNTHIENPYGNTDREQQHGVCHKSVLDMEIEDELVFVFEQIINILNGRKCLFFSSLC